MQRIDKPRMVLITDPKAIEALMSAGKYRESLAWWTKQGDALWVVKPVVQEGKRRCQNKDLEVEHK
jgi:hypothetical protein